MSGYVVKYLWMMRIVNAVAGLGLDDCDCLDCWRFQEKIYSITRSTFRLFKLYDCCD